MKTAVLLNTASRAAKQIFDIGNQTADLAQDKPRYDAELERQKKLAAIKRQRTADGFQPTRREMREARRALERMAAGRWAGEGDPARQRAIALAERTEAIVEADREEAYQAAQAATPVKTGRALEDVHFNELRRIAKQANVSLTLGITKHELIKRMRDSGIQHV